MNPKIRLTLVFVLTLLPLLAAQAQEQPQPGGVAPGEAVVPRLVRFSGALKDATGKLQTGPATLTFSLYKEEGDQEPLWQERQDVQLDEQGRYTVLLGASSADGLPLDLFTSNEARWLGVQAGNETEQLPRVLLVSVPYALKAGDAATLGGKTVSEFVLAKPEEAPGKNPGEKGVASAATAQGQKGTKDKNKGAAPSSPNVLAKFLADGTLGNSAVYEAGGLVGIGTTSPLLPLDVNGGTGAWGQIRAASTNQDTWVQLWSGYSAGGNPPAIIWSNQPAAHDLRFGFGGPLGDPFTEVMRIKGNGNVGIGTATPTSKLEINGFQPSLTLRDANGGKKGYVQNVDGNVALTTDSQASLVVRDISGNVGIGTDTPTSKLAVRGNGTDVLIGDAGCGPPTAAIGFGIMSGCTNFRLGGVAGGETVINRPTGSFVSFREGNSADQMRITAGGNIGIGTSTPTSRLHVVGTTRTGVLQIDGGADLSEQFEVRGAQSLASAASQEQVEPRVEPGMVVSIDPKYPGKLTVSSTAYDHRAAGVISGAGGVKTGMLMGQSGSVADGDQPVALAGRVYCWADASYGAIEPGDLLTTSETPGHAMKATDRHRAEGAIIGKAMTALKDGKGLILVLITLQ